jgi:hypothetical protein
MLISRLSVASKIALDATLAHPDQGGTDEQFGEVVEARDRLLEKSVQPYTHLTTGNPNSPKVACGLGRRAGTTSATEDGNAQVEAQTQERRESH